MQKKDQVFLYIKDEIEKISSAEEKEILDEAKAIEQEAYNQLRGEAEIDAKHQLDKELAEISSKASIEASAQLEERLKKLNIPIIRISAKNKTNINLLFNKINEIYCSGKIVNESSSIITNERHKNQIKIAKKSINDAIKSIENDMPIDISSIYIKQSLEDLGEITGKNVSENIVNEIFKKFCLGK